MEVPAYIQELIEKAASDAAEAAVVALKKQERAKNKGRVDRRLRNTRLLLKNYRTLKAHCTGAVYTDETGEHDGTEDETALELLDMMLQRNGSAVVESIRASCRRTKIIIRHIDTMLELYKTYCDRQRHTPAGDAIRRGYEIVWRLYISDDPLSVRQMAAEAHVSTRQIYRDLDAAVESISALMFGIDGLDMI